DPLYHARLLGIDRRRGHRGRGRVRPGRGHVRPFRDKPPRQDRPERRPGQSRQGGGGGGRRRPGADQHQRRPRPRDDHHADLGHSHGRYSASTWYADHFWPDLHERCVAHVNVDSTGGMGAEVLSEANTMAETVGFAGRAIREVAGQELDYKRFGRAGDQSFWGVGLPSIFMSLSGQPAQGGAVEEQMARLLGSGGRGRSGGLGWWWHTTEDTLDKIDRVNLVRDTRVYALTC